MGRSCVRAFVGFNCGCLCQNGKRLLITVVFSSSAVSTHRVWVPSCQCAAHSADMCTQGPGSSATLHLYSRIGYPLNLGTMPTGSNADHLKCHSQHLQLFTSGSNANWLKCRLAQISTTSNATVISQPLQLFTTGSNAEKVSRTGSRVSRTGAKVSRTGAKVSRTGAKVSQNGSKVSRNGPRR